MLIHGKNDSLIKFDHSKLIFEKLDKKLKESRKVLTHFP